MTRFTLLICVLLLLVPSSALAGPRKPLHVLIVQSENAVAQAQALTDALKRAVEQSEKFAPAEGEFSLEVMTLALGCSDPPDKTCLTQIAATIKSHQFVWGIMEREGGKLLVRLRLWQRGTNGAEVVARYATKQDQDRLTEIASTLLARLSGEPADEATLESEDPEPDPTEDPQGDLVVHAGNVDGQLVIDGRAYGRIRNGFAKVQVPAGDHEVLVRAAGYYEAIGDVVVEPKRRAEVTLHPERRDRPRRSDPAAQESNSGAGWAAIAVGGLLVAGGVYSVVKVEEINDDPGYERYRAEFPKSQNGCLEAERGTERPGTLPASTVASMCQEARTFQALQYLFFGLGGVAVGTGALILITDSSSPKRSPDKDEARRRAPRVEPRVAVGRTSAEVGMRLKF